MSELFSPFAFSVLWLTVKLAGIVSVSLLVIGTPLAWWLSQSQSKLKPIITVVVALPLILPPTVLGFYLLIFMGPTGLLGQLTEVLGIGSLAFTFTGLVIASMVYSLPFVVQPLYLAFSSIGKRPLEVAATLGASPVDRFFTVVLPMAKSGYVSAFILGFAHTLGEFGVVLMIGGNIPELTQVVSIQIYEHVEALEYQQAHFLSAVMVLFSFAILLSLYYLNKGALLSKSGAGSDTGEQGGKR